MYATKRLYEGIYMVWMYSSMAELVVVTLCMARTKEEGLFYLHKSEHHNNSTKQTRSCADARHVQLWCGQPTYVITSFISRNFLQVLCQWPSSRPKKLRDSTTEGLATSNAYVRILWIMLGVFKPRKHVLNLIKCGQHRYVITSVDQAKTAGFLPEGQTSWSHTLLLPKTTFPLRSTPENSEAPYHAKTTEGLYKWQVSSILKLRGSDLWRSHELV